LRPIQLAFCGKEILREDKELTAAHITSHSPGCHVSTTRRSPLALRSRLVIPFQKRYLTIPPYLPDLVICNGKGGNQEREGVSRLLVFLSRFVVFIPEGINDGADGTGAARLDGLESDIRAAGGCTSMENFETFRRTKAEACGSRVRSFCALMSAPQLICTPAANIMLYEFA
jgi:hypothetical protein